MVSDSAEQQPASAPTALDNLLARYPSGSIHTMEDASRAGDDVHKMHALIEAQFADEQKMCFPKFFATSCLIDAKERHRVALARVRVIEIEVNKFKRRANVAAREKALAVKRDKEPVELDSHRANENQNPLVTQNTPESSQTSPGSPAVKPHSSANARAEKRHNDVKKRQAAQAENEKQRAEHIAAYEKKRQESEARQRELAEKKLEKARAQSAKDASVSK